MIDALDYQWARRAELERFSDIPLARLDDAPAQQLALRGWQPAQVAQYLTDGWCVCECRVISRRPPRYAVLRAWGR